MAARKNTPWSFEEVQTFLGLVADERIQRELDCATRNEKTFCDFSELMREHGYERTSQQCQEKLKKLKSDYRAIKDHNGRSGSNRKSWKWFSIMDAIYGHRPASRGRDAGLDSATALMETLVEDDNTSVSHESSTTTDMEPILPRVSTPVAEAGSPTTSTAEMALPRCTARRNRTRMQDQLTVVRQILEADAEQQQLNREQRERHWERRDQQFRLLIEDAARTRELEAAFRHKEMEETAAFNRAFLGTLTQLVEVLRHKAKKNHLPPE